MKVTRDRPKETSARDAGRTLGDYGVGRPGPLLLAFAGVHGNEPGGVEAVRRVVAELERSQAPLRGRFAAVAGNVEALRRGVRFVDQDLNRMWWGDAIDDLERSDPASDNTEQRELRELLSTIRDELNHGYYPPVLVDLHSTSSRSRPFTLICDTIQNRRLAFALPLPVILGFEESIEGTVIDYFGEMGYMSVVVEGGRHQDQSTADHLESALWTLFVAAGMLDAKQVPDLARHRRRLRQASPGRRSIVEVCFRHGLDGANGFEMRDGFENFQHVKRGELLARDHSGEIRSPDDGILLLPRYQPIGDDGFLLGRRVRRFWLRLSTLLRHVRADRLVHLLPGVQRRGENALQVDPHIARVWVKQVFHLLGFRRRRSDGRLFIFARRPERPIER